MLPVWLKQDLDRLRKSSGSMSLGKYIRSVLAHAAACKMTVKALEGSDDDGPSMISVKVETSEPERGPGGEVLARRQKQHGGLQ